MEFGSPACCRNGKTAKSRRTENIGPGQGPPPGRPLNGLNANPVDLPPKSAGTVPTPATMASTERARPNPAGHHHQPILCPVQAAVVSAVIRPASAPRAFWKLSMGSGRFVTVRSPRKIRVGRQDHRFPIRRNALAAKRKAASSASTAPQIRESQQRTRISGVKKMRPVVGNVGREWAETAENLVFGRVVLLDRIGELAGP
jgi:hypothetical protein